MYTPIVQYLHFTQSQQRFSAFQLSALDASELDSLADRQHVQGVAGEFHRHLHNQPPTPSTIFPKKSDREILKVPRGISNLGIIERGYPIREGVPHKREKITK